MTQIPCPNCGELLECSEKAIGRRMACPRCRTLLRLDADSEGRPGYCRPYRRFGLIRLAVVLGVFLVGLGTGFVWGRGSAHFGQSGVSATSVGFFSASNSIVVEDGPPPPARPVKPAAPPMQCAPP